MKLNTILNKKDIVLSNIFSLEALIRVIVCTTFGFSAITKLLVLGEFELYLYQLPFFTWNLSLIIARLIISVEFAIALLFLLNSYTKQNVVFTIFVLTGFSLYLLLNLIAGSPEENCFCFGEAFQINTFESLFKNAILIAITILIYRKRRTGILNNKLVFASILLISLSVPVILNPPDFLFKKRYIDNDEIPTVINNSLFLDAKVIADSAQIVQHDRLLVCFFSMGCKYCKWAAKRVSIMNRKSAVPLHIVYVFYGRQERLESFWEDSQSDIFPYYISRSSNFFRYSGKSVPALLLINNDTIIKRDNYRSFNEKETQKFLTVHIKN